MPRLEYIKEKIKDRILGVEKNPESVKDLYEYTETENARTREDEWKDFLKYQKYPFIVGILYAITILHMILGVILSFLALHNLNPSFLPGNPFYIFLWLFGPPAIWIWSTAFTYWNFHNRKIATLYLVIAADLISVFQQLIRFFMPPVLKATLLIPITREVTIPMVVHLSQGIIFVLSLLPCVAIFLALHNMIQDKYAKQEVEHFKVTRDLDLRTDKEFEYDFAVVEDMDTGEYRVVREKDRFLHGFADGTTGTAKTSSVLTVAVCNDLDQRVHNIDYQKKECAKALRSGEFKIVKPFEDGDFSISCIAPAETADKKAMQEREEKYNFLRDTSKSCGITVVAPNESWADDVYNLATARGFKVNRIDPILGKDGNPKPGFVGFNPLYVSPTLTGKERDVDITNKASIFADVLSGLFERGGGGDYYFTTLNNSWTIATCMLLMVTYDPEEDANQPNPADVQMILNDVEKARPYLKRLADRFGNNGGPHDMNDPAWLPLSEQILRTKIDWTNCGINCGNYQYIWDLFFNDILGPSKAKMHDQANGLRMQINKFLTHPLIRNVLCVPDRLAVDIDRILEQGEITTVNYAWELGKSVSMAFGQFWILSFGKAVVRRNPADRHIVPHFNYIDEFAILLHPDVEEFFSLHRQYVCANFVAFQTLDQMNKSRETEYLKGVLLGNCATQILFGRISPTEMQTYERMAGMVAADLEQHTVSETSITTENPSYSYSTRTTMQMEKRMEGSDMRYRDFQEVTMFTVQNGTPEEPFVGRVEFLPPSRRKGTPRVKVFWQQFFTDDVYNPQSMDKRFRPWYRKVAEDSPAQGSGFRVDASAPPASPEMGEPYTPPAPGRAKTSRFTSRGVVNGGAMTVVAGREAPPASPEEKKDIPPSPAAQPSPASLPTTDPNADGDGGLNDLFKDDNYDVTGNVRSAAPPAAPRKSRRRAYTAGGPDQTSTGRTEAVTPPAPGRAEMHSSPEALPTTASPEGPERPQEAPAGDFRVPVGGNLTPPEITPVEAAEAPVTVWKETSLPAGGTGKTGGDKEGLGFSSMERQADMSDGSLAAMFENAPVYSGNARPASVSGQDVIMPPSAGEKDADIGGENKKKRQADGAADGIPYEVRYEAERARHLQEARETEMRREEAPADDAEPAVKPTDSIIYDGFL